MTLEWGRIMSVFTQMIYCSRNSARDAESLEAEVRDILAVSRTHNERAGITGALLLARDCYAQVLEGPKEALEPLFERIRADPRHHEFVALPALVVPERMFADWSMGFTTPHADDEDAAIAVLERAFSEHDEAAALDTRALVRKSIGRACIW